MSRPFFKLYGRDFRDGVRPLTLEETGAYTLLLTLIYDAGGPIADDGEAIRRQLGCDRRVWARIRARLLALGKLRITGDGRLTNERAEREIEDLARVSEVRSEAGRRGGQRSGAARRRASGASSPEVGDKSGKSPADFSAPTPENALRGMDPAEAIASKAEPEPEYYPSTGARTRARKHPPDEQPEGVLARCIAAAGPGLADPAHHPGLTMTAPRIAAAIAAGCDLERDILPVIAKRTALPRASPIATWAYFEAAWVDARNKRLAPLPTSSPTEPDHGRHRAPAPARRDPRARRQVHLDAWAEILGERGELAVVGGR